MREKMDREQFTSKKKQVKDEDKNEDQDRKTTIVEYYEHTRDVYLEGGIKQAP